ncbi:hypothetical protein WSS_A29184 [Rhodococcus opacus M213]|uniref:Uncharacterized protein n=1 Tax=Rhodococcus opacus M213 TaxID=1129896 RepID=K8XPU0_RHOOP|nr:hypothetical protein [Rhodococcus opacus]EKT79045.1 hypothetical protein WSS_A29184 [Rhodococcus opacus M213]
MDLTDPEYALKWPREVFVAEATDMMRTDRERQSFRADYTLLLEEAFAGSAPATEHSSVQGALDWSGTTRSVWTQSVASLQAITENVPVVSELVRRADELRLHTARPPYFSRRNSSSPPDDRATGEPDWAAAKERFSTFVARWQSTGYFGDMYPNGCVDGDDDEPTMKERLTELYGHEPPPLVYNEGDAWSDDEFCDLVELLHDVAARPRTRYNHEFSQCGYHYSDHALRTGQLFYRIRVNELLAAARLPFQLATQGEDAGRLVTITDDARADLLVQVAQQPTPRLTDQVGHAIALYRSRQSTREDKISAIRELMAVLEPDRYTVVKNTAVGADNESLFRIANTYAIRHNKDTDLRDYSTAFLDWMFWSTLAMVQLCKNLKSEGIVAKP